MLFSEGSWSSPDWIFQDWRKYRRRKAHIMFCPQWLRSGNARLRWKQGCPENQHFKVSPTSKPFWIEVNPNLGRVFGSTDVGDWLIRLCISAFCICGAANHFCCSILGWTDCLFASDGTYNCSPSWSGHSMRSGRPSGFHPASYQQPICHWKSQGRSKETLFNNNQDYFRCLLARAAF